MAQFLYRLHPVRSGMLTEGPTEREADVIGAHFEYLSRLTEQGIVLMAGRTLTTDEATFGIVVFVARTEPEAEAIMNGDPAVRHGVMRAPWFPFRAAPRNRDGPPEALGT
ncbi:MAG TPA: YciI family protein [Casimicrobiaceae bacterium]|nr:YciI family protein [Casimicrobiaceae bacterium]